MVEGRPEPCDCAVAVSHGTRIRSAFSFAVSLFRQVLPYLLLGAGIGAFIYGFVPEGLIVSLAGPDNPLAIPVAAVIGVRCTSGQRRSSPSVPSSSRRGWASGRSWL